MMGDGPRRDHETLGDIEIAQTFGGQPEHLDLAPGQMARVGPRRRPWRTGDMSTEAPWTVRRKLGQPEIIHTTPGVGYSIPTTTDHALDPPG
jgi:hypothetical protein